MANRILRDADAADAAGDAVQQPLVAIWRDLSMTLGFPNDGPGVAWLPGS